MNRICILLFYFFPLCLTSCSYQLSPSINKTTLVIHVPKIENDHLDTIRSAIIRSLAQHNIVTSLTNTHSTHQLCISLVEYNSENIGFSYSPTVEQITSQKDFFLISNEGRLSIKAKVLLKNQHNQIVLKTLCQEETSFDFEPDLTKTSIHNFSLGQMNMYDEAKNIAETVLFEKLGSTIGSIVSYEMY